MFFISKVPYLCGPAVGSVAHQLATDPGVSIYAPANAGETAQSGRTTTAREYQAEGEMSNARGVFGHAPRRLYIGKVEEFDERLAGLERTDGPLVLGRSVDRTMAGAGR